MMLVCVVLHFGVLSCTVVCGTETCRTSCTLEISHTAASATCHIMSDKSWLVIAEAFWKEASLRIFAHLAGRCSLIGFHV